jgi:bifunctional non-homologous end joining protein LigD
VAKRLDSRYEPGQRSGAWQKMRLNQSQEFVIGELSVAQAGAGGLGGVCGVDAGWALAAFAFYGITG